MDASVLLFSRRAVLRAAAAGCLIAVQILAQSKSPDSGSLDTGNLAAENAERIYDLGPGIAPPKVIHQVVPEYSGQGFRLNGTVLLRVVVNSKGVVKRAQVVRGVAPDVDQCALKAIEQWRFQAATKDAKPVAVSLEIEIHFNDI